MTGPSQPGASSVTDDELLSFLATRDHMTGRCPHCEEEVTPRNGGEPGEHSGVATVWVCPVCDTILGISEWMD